MAHYEIECDECYGHIEGVHATSVKTICIHCYRDLQKRNKELEKEIIKLKMRK